MGIEIGPLCVRRSAFVEATIERVWRKFESFDRLGAEAGAELRAYEAGWHARHLEALKAIVEG